MQKKICDGLFITRHNFRGIVILEKGRHLANDLENLVNFILPMHCMAQSLNLSVTCSHFLHFNAELINYVIN